MNTPSTIVILAAVFVTVFSASACTCGNDESGSRAVHSASTQETKPASITIDHHPFDTILRRHVRNGLVDYQGLKKDAASLRRYLEVVAATDPRRLPTRAEKLAFYINAYNAYVLDLVLRHSPVKSVMEVPGFFDNLPIAVGGRSMTLNELEAEARGLGDPRVHFAVNCASRSCPILEERAWTAADLDARLEAATRRYLADDRHGARVSEDGRTLWLSKIFQWYAKDFAKSGTQNDVIAWVRPRLEKEARRRLAAAPRVVWLDYDWSLNRLPPVKTDRR